MRLIHIRHIIFVIISLVFLSCDGPGVNPVPSFPVYLELDIQGQYPHFVPDNGYQALLFHQARYDRTEYVGYSGVLVWIDMQGKYQACDLCCPHCVIQNKPVELDGLFAVCPTCGEHYDLSYGIAFPTKNISKFTLRKFSVASQVYKLIIRN